MRSRLPPLNPLRTFEAAAKLGSMTRAAEELNVTHGAVSHQVRALEDALGVKLFVRRGHALQLTSAGRALLPATSTALDGIRDALERIRGLRAEGELSISCVPGFLSSWLIPNLSGFAASYPDITLNIMPRNDMLENREQGPEVMIRYGAGRWPDLWVRHLSDVELFPIVGPALHRRHPIRALEDLVGRKLLHAGTRLEWNNWLTARDALEIADGRHHVFSDAQLTLQAAAADLGVALGDHVTAGPLLRRGDVVAPLGLSARAVHGFHVACRSEFLTVPQVRAFIDWLFETYIP